MNVLVRIDRDLRDKLKRKASGEGRTMEWLLNDALVTYLALSSERIHVEEVPEEV